MKKNVKSISELPAWFDLKNYITDREDYLSAQARIGQILKRMTLYKALKDDRIDREILLNEMDSISKNPFNDSAIELRMKQKTELTYSLFLIEMMQNVFGKQIKPVIELTVGSALERFSRVDLELLEDFEYYENCERTKSFTYAHVESGERLQQLASSVGMTDNHKAILEIDLRASDKIIISQFAEWLKTFRAKNEKSSEIAKNGEFLLGRIKNYNLLAFIDLYFLWSELEGVVIKPSLAARLFECSESEISKTIKPLAYSLLNPDGDSFKQLCILGHNPSHYMMMNWS